MDEREWDTPPTWEEMEKENDRINRIDNHIDRRTAPGSDRLDDEE